MHIKNKNNNMHTHTHTNTCIHKASEYSYYTYIYLTLWSETVVSSAKMSSQYIIIIYSKQGLQKHLKKLVFSKCGVLKNWNTTEHDIIHTESDFFKKILHLTSWTSGSTSCACWEFCASLMDNSLWLVLHASSWLVCLPFWACNIKSTSSESELVEELVQN